MFEKLIGIDLGTVNVLVYVKGRGIVLQEPSVVAVDVRENKIVAVGKEAREMLGKSPESIEVSRPLRNGVIADYMVTEAMLRYFISKISGRLKFFKPKVMLASPKASPVWKAEPSTMPPSRRERRKLI
jgi:rod shape-determining protein MreB